MAEGKDSKAETVSKLRTRSIGTLRHAFSKNLQVTDLSQEPIRGILRKAGKVLNVRGKQFHNLVDVSLSDEESEPPAPKRLSGPPQSVALKRAFGIEEPRKSGQALMDFFGDRWIEFYATSGEDKSQTSESASSKPLRKPNLQPDLSSPISDLRRPWYSVLCDESYDPPDPARPNDHDRDSPPPSPDPGRYSCSW